MKLLWIADFSVKDNKGGAQQTNEVMIKAGRKRGHTIKLATGGSVGDSKQRYDGIIINNITKYSEEQIKELVDTGKCIRYEHDHWVAENYPELYKQVKHTIFLSPLHKESIEKKVGYKIENSSLIPSPIDSKRFTTGEEKEPNTAIYTGNICKEKGMEGLIEYAKENEHLKFYVIGWGSMVEDIKGVDNIEYIEGVDQKELVSYYQKCEYFYHKPEWEEPFGRTVIEAYLCGCNLLLNNNVGAISWDWDFSDYDAIKKNVQSEDKFWKIIEDEIQTSGDME
jgi:glycosyltransferase involved in cell wall biosynthesis